MAWRMYALYRVPSSYIMLRQRKSSTLPLFILFRILFHVEW